MTTAFATSGKVKLHYVDEGEGEPSFVFVHGWCCDHTFFEPQFTSFKRSHRAVALDLRGCGRSERPDSGYDIPTLADDLAGLCHELGVTKPVIVGHSLGGMIGVELAARYPALPKAVVAVDPGPLAATPEARAVFASLITQLEGPDGEAVREAYVTALFDAHDDLDRRRRITETMCSVPMPVAISVMRGVVDWNGLGALLLCQVPLLVLRSRTGGSNDPARLLALKPDVQIAVTVGAGHFHQLEVPEQVTPMIARFVSTLG
jgi:pimeloyl-ACP methyl ester carboxylesterase